MYTAGGYASHGGLLCFRLVATSFKVRQAPASLLPHVHSLFLCCFCLVVPRIQSSEAFPHIELFRSSLISFLRPCVRTVKAHHSAFALEESDSQMLAWLGQFGGVLPYARLGCVALPQDAVGAHHAVDKLGAQSVTRHYRRWNRR